MMIPRTHRFAVAMLLVTLFCTYCAAAEADWRWARHTPKKQTVSYTCNTYQCLKQVFAKERKKLKAKIRRHDRRRLREWRKWTRLYIPACTWYGESGYGPQYARYRYTTWNLTGSGARGKFQFMPGTYFNRAKYFDWSPLDQEIAARREYWANGTSPWTNCHG